MSFNEIQNLIHVSYFFKIQNDKPIYFIDCRNQTAKGKLIPEKELVLDALFTTKSYLCSETDFAIRCENLPTCTASNFEEATGSCTLLSNETIDIRFRSGSSIRIRPGRIFISLKK